jgi:UDP-N-acetylglucosamine 2-epimerase (non-hydrolysing)
MKTKPTIAVIFGTRPDTIKLAPLILGLKRERKHFRTLAIATAQHRQMLDQVLDVFNIRPDYDLDSMKPKQTLAEITRNTIARLDDILESESPDLVVVQGDTTTTFVGSLAAFYRRIPVAHVEAGLRTNNKSHPFPEEINRRLTSVLTDLHFAPTVTARNALVRERVDPSSVYVTGNTVIDALRYSVKTDHRFSVERVRKLVHRESPIILVTLHRRESWGPPMSAAATALRRIAERYPEINIVFPMHLNPVVREIVRPILGNSPNVHLLEPLDYADFVNLMARSLLILTDSGGVQEEGPALGKPVLVLREVTERPEAIAFGTAKLVGLDGDRIYRTTSYLLDHPGAYRTMANATNPYGDGRATKRMIGHIKKFFHIATPAISDFTPKEQ